MMLPVALQVVFIIKVTMVLLPVLRNTFMPTEVTDPVLFVLLDSHTVVMDGSTVQAADGWIHSHLQGLIG